MTRPRLAVAVAICLLLVASPVLVAAAAHGPGAVGGPAAQADLDPDTTLLDVALQPDGDAIWTVSYRIRLDDENTTAAFRSIKADIAEDPGNYSAAFERRMTRTVRAAENATGRQMALRNLTVSARNETLPQPTGVIVYRFEWTNFAVQAGERLRAGDAIDQLYLDASTQLAIGWPADYHLTSVTPPTTRTDSDEVVWAGPLDFDAGEPRVVVAPGAPPANGDSGGGAGSGIGATQVLVVAVVAALLAGGVWLFARSAGLRTPLGGEEPPDGAAAGAAGESPAAGEAAGTTGEPSAAGEAGAATPPEELLSNEERVLKLVREAGGRKKQKEIAEELDWTAAKTSQVVGNLRDDDELEAFRLGRENVLRLPGEDPLGAQEGGGEETDAEDAGDDSDGDAGGEGTGGGRS